MVAHVMKDGRTALGNDNSHEISRMTCLTVEFPKESGADESGTFL